MGDLLGFLFLAVIVLISIISKINEQRKAAERRQSGAKQVTAKDLPPETRRAIYGSTEVPVARARGAEPQPTAQPVQPRVARPAQPRRPVQARPVAQQARPAIRRRETVVRRTAAAAPSLRERAQAIRTQIEQAFEGAVEEAALLQQPPKIPRRPTPQPARRLERAPAPTAGPRPTQRRASQKPAPEPPRRKAAPARALFSGMDDVRRGIIMSEVLGPPKAMR